MAARWSRSASARRTAKDSPKIQGVKIAGVGHFAPSRIVSNADLEQWLDTSDEWIVTRTGMNRRHWSADDETTGDLAYEAAAQALANARIQPREIDCFIVCTVTPDYAFPATACLVAARLGAKDKPAFDISIACSGFIYGLTTAASLIRSGVYRKVLLIGAETLSKIVNKEDRSTAILFGDGAGAVILEASQDDSFLSAELGADGSRPELLYRNGSYIHMQGKEVFKFAVHKMQEVTEKALARANLSKAEVALLIPHQANKRIIDAAARYLDMPEEKVVINIAEYGNTSAASIPIALSETVQAGGIAPGDVIVFVAFGGGLSWGAVAWKWQQCA